jgi:hypothetical protein
MYNQRYSRDSKVGLPKGNIKARGKKGYLKVRDKGKEGVLWPEVE